MQALSTPKRAIASSAAVREDMAVATALWVVRLAREMEGER